MYLYGKAGLPLYYSENMTAPFRIALSRFTLVSFVSEFSFYADPFMPVYADHETGLWNVRNKKKFHFPFCQADLSNPIHSHPLPSPFKKNI
jgi:hypothetical protein